MGEKGETSGKMDELSLCAAYELAAEECEGEKGMSMGAETVDGGGGGSSVS